MADSANDALVVSVFLLVKKDEDSVAFEQLGVTVWNELPAATPHGHHKRSLGPLNLRDELVCGAASGLYDI